MFTKEIYFIRHGETDWNKMKKTQGQEADIPLNEEGELQSLKTGLYLKNFRCIDGNFDCILSSPMIRAEKTATLIANELNYDRPIIFMKELMEIKKGQMSGLTGDDDFIKKMELDAKIEYDKIIDPIEKYKISGPEEVEIFYDKIVGDIGVERYDELKQRIMVVINYLKSCEYKKIIVVSHSGFMDTLFQLMYGLYVLPKGDLTHGKNCSISYCKLEDDKFTMISPLNTKHLRL